MTTIQLSFTILLMVVLLVKIADYLVDLSITAVVYGAKKLIEKFKK